MPEDRRLIEVAFPLKQASIDSVHEKTARHGHTASLHLWPARRPLAASRAALIAALLPEPSTSEDQSRVLERLGGRVVEKIERKSLGGRTVEKVKEETVGGILHWGREIDPDVNWFRQKIREAYDGRAPKILDPFAGGGAIPLEAMRLGCEVTAIDINPVAWFILKCTLEYPQKLAGQTRPLPEFALKDRQFMEAFLKAKGFKGAGLRTMLERLGHGDGGEIQLDALPHDDPTLEADFAWHVRAWGRWVLADARKDLAPYYPTYAVFAPLKPDKEYEEKPMRLLEADEDGIPQIDPLNAEFDETYLKDTQNPRWIAKPTVAYLWARTVGCKHCRVTIPLLKTRWLCKTAKRRILLSLQPNSEKSEVSFGIESDVPNVGGNAAQRREHDKRLSRATMSRSGAKCPCCDSIMSLEDLRHEGRSGRLGYMLYAVAVEGLKGKEFRLPTPQEIETSAIPESALSRILAEVPHSDSDPETPTNSQYSGIFNYGMNNWSDLFSDRQTFSLYILLRQIRSFRHSFEQDDSIWSEAISSYLMVAFDRLLDFCNVGVQWKIDVPTINHYFVRFALPISWDYAEGNVTGKSAGSFLLCLDRICTALDSYSRWQIDSPPVTVICNSAKRKSQNQYDLIITDPPYYDAIPYSDIMDLFYVWLRKGIADLSNSHAEAFQHELGPKWDADKNDGELVDDHLRFKGDKLASKQNYESGMYDCFRTFTEELKDDGKLVIVFANKSPDAWETLVSALIRAGFVVDASWPIQTEQLSRMRAITSAALASSVWLVCRKRVRTARPGWDNNVLIEMRENITQKLRDFWDVGIRGPDFVWAATGPAMEAFSKYPVVKKANDPNQFMTVSEFLREVRRMVVDFVVGRVLTHDGGEEVVTGLDDVTTYYLLHRHDFGMDEAPIGACILYALSCNLSDSALVNQFDVLGQSGKSSAGTEDDEDEAAEDAGEDEGSGSGAKVKLKAWNRRLGRNLGLEAPGGRPVPLIDQVHKLMHLWRAGDQVKVDDYLDSRGLNRNALFNQILQALIELAAGGSDERSLLESLSNHVAARGGISAPRQGQLV